MNNLLLLLGVIFLIAFLIRLKISIAVSVFLASIFVAIFKGVINQFPKLALETLLQIDTINMIIVIIIVTYLGELLKASHFLDEITSNFKKILPTKVFLPLLPMTIGLIPMPGGALVSAPMVGEGAKDVSIKDEEKALLNFWFRHVWEPISPLYPEFLLGVSTLGVSIIDVLKVQWIVSLGMLISGIVVITPHINNSSNGREKINGKTLLSLLKIFSPIIVIFAFILIFKNLPSFIALFVGLVYVILLKRIDFRTLVESFIYKKILEYVLLIFSIFLLREVINYTRFAQSVYNELTLLNVPQALILFFLPLSIGFLTGVSSASIGITYPLLMPLLKTNGTLISSNLLIAYYGVWTALLFTPTHLCLSLSVEYFKASFYIFYKKMLPAFLILTVFIIFWYIVLL